MIHVNYIMKHEFFDSLRPIIIHTNVEISEVSSLVCAHTGNSFFEDEKIIQQQQAASDGMIFLTDLICEVN
jgi:hypothetical protein